MLSIIKINDFYNYLTFTIQRTIKSHYLTLYFVKVRNKFELTIKKNLKILLNIINLLIY